MWWSDRLEIFRSFSPWNGKSWPGYDIVLEVDRTSGAEYLDFACCYAGLLGVFRRHNGSPGYTGTINDFVKDGDDLRSCSLRGLSTYEARVEVRTCIIAYNNRSLMIIWQRMRAVSTATFRKKMAMEDDPAHGSREKKDRRRTPSLVDILSCSSKKIIPGALGANIYCIKSALWTPTASSSACWQAGPSPSEMVDLRQTAWQTNRNFLKSNRVIFMKTEPEVD